MLHNDVAQQRPGEKPASAPKTSQKSPRAQVQAKFKIPTLKRAGSQHEDIDAAGLRDGNRETTYIIHIHGRHSPPTRLQLTNPATTPQSPTKFLHHKPMLLPQPARNHSFGKGHVHARSVLGPELGTEQQQLYAWHGTPSKSAAKVIQPQPPALPPEAWPCDATQTRPNSQREIRSS
jgi:hypothetical protein